MRKHCEKMRKKCKKQEETLVSAAKELPNPGGEAILHFFQIFSHIFHTRFRTFRMENIVFPKIQLCLGKCYESVENVQKSAKPIGFSCRSGPRTLRLHFIRTLFTLYLHFCVLLTPSTYTLFALYLHFFACV